MSRLCLCLPPSRPLALALALAGVVASAYAPAAAVPVPYPTLETVEAVLVCMKEHGGKSLDNLYACACAHDVMVKNLTFAEFVEARTFDAYKNMPGEKGAVFRDSKRGQEILERLQILRGRADQQCFQRPGGGPTQVPRAGHVKIAGSKPAGARPAAPKAVP